MAPEEFNVVYDGKIIGKFLKYRRIGMRAIFSQPLALKCMSPDGEDEIATILVCVEDGNLVVRHADSIDRLASEVFSMRKSMAYGLIGGIIASVIIAGLFHIILNTIF